jgi:hypothetical protein
MKSSQAKSSQVILIQVRESTSIHVVLRALRRDETELRIKFLEIGRIRFNDGFPLKYR